mgnify:CR=1 FL=1
MAIDENLYKERNRFVDDKLSMHERRLNNHGDRIDKLEQYQSKAEEQIKHLCSQIQALVKAIWWAIGLTITTFVGFFIWYVQNVVK